MKNLTIIEDDASTREILNMIFDKEYYNVTLLEDGNDVITHALPQTDLFIIDRFLSGADGLELCRYIKSSVEYRGIPVMIISGAPGIEASAREAGAEAVLPKPFKIKVIREIVARTLAGKYRFNE